MLILINQDLIDIGDPMETLAGLGLPDVRVPGLARIVALGQDAAFAANGMEHAHAGVRRTLAAFMGVLGEVNCALFLCPPKARSPRDVAVRLGHAPLTTMVFLLSAQQTGALTPALINQHVWRLAGDVAAA